jgi:hypothetical protein
VKNVNEIEKQTCLITEDQEEIALKKSAKENGERGSRQLENIA